MSTTGPRAFETPPSMIVVSLGMLYGLMTAYGLVAIAVGVPTLRIVTGELFELVWPMGIAALAVASGLSLRHSWRTGRLMTEELVSGALVLWLNAFSVALLFRGIFEPNPADLAACFLPAGFSSVPAIRVLAIHIRRAARAARE